MKTYCKHLIFMIFTTRSISCSQFSPVSPHTAFSLFQATWNVLCRSEGFHFSASWYPWIIFDIWFEWHCKPKCQKRERVSVHLFVTMGNKSSYKQFFNLIPQHVCLGSGTKLSNGIFWKRLTNYEFNSVMVPSQQYFCTSAIDFFSFLTFPVRIMNKSTQIIKVRNSTQKIFQ